MSIPEQTSELSERLGQVTLSPSVSGQTCSKVSVPPSTTPISPDAKNGIAKPAPTGIPKYAIPYRRPTLNSPENQFEDSITSSNGNSHERERPNLDSCTRAASLASSPYSPEVDSSSSNKNQINGQFYSNDSNDSFRSLENTNAGPRSGRNNRAMSEDLMMGDSESEYSGAASSSGKPKIITSKIGSLSNANYRPGGGDVTILDRKLDFSHAQSKCKSKVNLKYKPGGGDVVIVDTKLNFEAKSKVKSFENAKHVPGGGDVKIDCQKINFREAATSKIGSAKNIHHRPGGGDVKIFNERLPWLRYNKPNLAVDERARINKQRSSDMTGSQHSSTHS